MKTSFYLTVFFVVTAFLVLTSCSKDDDGINDAGTCTITIDDIPFNAKYISGEIWEHNGVNYMTIWINSIADDDSFIFEVVDEPNNDYFVSLEKGANLISSAKDSYPTVTVYQGDDYWNGDIIAGSAILSEFSREDKKATIQLTNCRLKDYATGSVHIINGTLSAPLKGADNKVKL